MRVGPRPGAPSSKASPRRGCQAWTTTLTRLEARKLEPAARAGGGEVRVVECPDDGHHPRVDVAADVHHGRLRRKWTDELCVLKWHGHVEEGLALPDGMHGVGERVRVAKAQRAPGAGREDGRLVEALPLVEHHLLAGAVRGCGWCVHPHHHLGHASLPVHLGTLCPATARACERFSPAPRRWWQGGASAGRGPSHRDASARLAAAPRRRREALDTQVRAFRGTALRHPRPFAPDGRTRGRQAARRHLQGEAEEVAHGATLPWQKRPLARTRGCC